MPTTDANCGELPLPNVLKAYHGDELMGVAGTGSNICVGGDHLYVRLR